jgi:hypothetical protein
MVRMPCYLFTYHSYGSWMPDREEGFTRRDALGTLPPNRPLANVYRAQAKESTVWFEDSIQRVIITELFVASAKQDFRLHYAASDPSHVQVLASWRHPAGRQKLKANIRSSITRRLNRELGRRQWFSEGGSARRVIGDAHFRHLFDNYLPSHRGWKWSETAHWIEPDENAV